MRLRAKDMRCLWIGGGRSSLLSGLFGACSVGQASHRRCRRRFGSGVVRGDEALVAQVTSKPRSLEEQILEDKYAADAAAALLRS